MKFKISTKILIALCFIVGFIAIMATMIPFNTTTNNTTPSDEPTYTSVPTENINETTEPVIIQANIPSVTDYDGIHAWVQINNGEPYFSDTDKSRLDPFETYSELDNLGRCGVAYANICKDIMPTENRGEIGSVKPSGWHTAKYDIVDGKYLYNRCHLIGFQLAGENANPKNLITGTRYLNIQGMLDAENMIAAYVKETNNHVLYRVTPIFRDDNLIADGVLMEAWSVEDNGDGICFNIFAFNVQPGIQIDYQTGNSSLIDTTSTTSTDNTHYILNTNSHKFHNPDCSSINNISEQNKSDYYGNREELINQGYTPCGFCNP